MTSSTTLTGIPPPTTNGLPNRSSTPDLNNSFGLPSTASPPSDPSTSTQTPSGEPQSQPQPQPPATHPGQNMPDSGPIGLPPCTANGGQCPNSISTSTTVLPTSSLATSTPHTDVHDDGFSSDDNMHDNSNTSSVQVTPKFKQTRFQSRKVLRAPSSGHAGIETSVLSCELALLNALSNDVENSIEGLDKEQWKTRIAQINQVVRMVQWEAQGLYGLA